MLVKKIKSKQLIGVAIVIAIGVLLAVLVLNTEKIKANDKEHGHDETEVKITKEEHQHAEQAQEIIKGPHGGKLFTQDGFSIEVTIFEQNSPPEFRVYSYQNGKAIDPLSATVIIQLERLGSEPQKFNFTKENDYLKSNTVVEEPHSFKVNIKAKYNSKNYQFNYEQVEARVKVNNAQVLHNNIEVLTAGRAKIKTTLHLQGEVKLNADKSVHIVPRVDGIVESVIANAGDKVHKGQVLATISSQAVADLRSDLLAARKRTELAKTTYQREKSLWEEKISAQQDYLQAQHDFQEAQINTSRLQQKLGVIGASANGQARYEIRSPIDGVITNKQVSQGQVVSKVDDIFEVADLSSVWVEMAIYAKDLNTVKTGQKVTIKATAFDAQAVGSISYVGVLVGEQSRTAMARVILANDNRAWLPGLPVNIDLTSDEVEVPLAVSLEGIQTLNDSSVVFGRYGEFFEARPLILGRRDDKYVEVLEGLKVGDHYAAGNSFLIKADIGKAGASHDH